MPNEIKNPIKNGTVQSFGAYHDEINIPLFNDIISFITKTTAEPFAETINRLASNHLWYSDSSNNDIQEQYGFRYFGELLERYEDKACSDIKDIRAIALAMAYSRDLLTKDMFVGKQKYAFIKKIKAMAKNDLYLKGAIYLLNKDESDDKKLFNELTQMKYERTEQLLFALSLHDEFEDAFEIFKPQLIEMLSISRSISVYENMGIYSWLIKQISAIIKKHRSKDMALFRALITLPTAFVKQGSRQYDILLDNNYTPDEIIFMNSAILTYRPLQETLYTDSITAEKIAVQLCETFINSESTHSESIYAYLKWILDFYEKFYIKIQGNEGIYSILKDKIELKNPQTFSWLYKIDKGDGSYNSEKRLDIFYFDILDDNWDMLADELSKKDYQKLFDKQLKLKNDDTPNQIKSYVDKYDSLFESPFLKSFENEYHWERDGVFSLLVEKGLVNLIDFFKKCPGYDSKEKMDKKHPLLEYIEVYIDGIQSREAFEFFKYFFKNFDYEHMHRLFDNNSSSWNREYKFADKFYCAPRNYYNNEKVRINIERKFLSAEEHKEFFNWIDSYMYTHKPDSYIEFSIHVLLEPFIRTLYPKEELRKIYDMVCNCDMEITDFHKNSQKLKEIYLSEYELQAERETNEAKRNESKRLEKETKIQELKDEFEKEYNGMFKSLYKYTEHHKYSFQDDVLAIPIVYGYLSKTLENNEYTLTPKDFSLFLKVCATLINYGCLTVEEMKIYVLEIREEKENVKDNGEFEDDFDDE